MTKQAVAIVISRAQAVELIELLSRNARSYVLVAGEGTPSTVVASKVTVVGVANTVEEVMEKLNG